VTWFRIFVIGGWLSYAALFSWISPLAYATTMLALPFFQIVFFVLLGRSLAANDDLFFLVGNGIQISALAGIHGMAMVIVNERQFGTLPAVLASPASRSAIFLGRSAPIVANGLMTSVFGLAAGTILLGIALPTGKLPAAASIMALVAFSTSGLGLLIGGIGIRFRDISFVANLGYLLTLLLCGVNFPIEFFPEWLGSIAHAIPATNGIEAARALFSGAPADAVIGPMVREGALGLVYMGVGLLSLRALERQARRGGSLETF
jgi:ABC-2 type transport system permease protein